ncbi:TPA: hypothetical protein RF372_000467 [Listeria monocytogenes]|uniref:Lin1277 protein n=1 Tax=Listeria innocua serovar 6a (strain ATCC BAA-680 / CLIP 11262) TaxID=272626 RepID=Q92CB2_LISIN|nr:MULTISPECIES: hypothetical protein [Listeria]EIJ1867433.1 hypothetical protein [Listeria monocytogenes]EIT8827388.1 hypothetical protein [Listeria monocytogenes]EKG5416399.1 hypothetical protein [Listeria monocytogenes]EKG5605736.1 hypothetical protein [Listeria monocytogenes]EKR1322598.1 hypothetical protein [Listeria monocytogenes]
MANVKNVTKKAVEVSDVTQNQQAEETQFSVEQLKEHSRAIFGVQPEVIDGAFFAHTGNQITKTEARNLIDNFLRKVVK